MQTKILTLQELEVKIANANKAYANGLPFLTDTEYDIFWQQLYAFDPNHHLLYHTANDPTIAYDLTAHHHQIFGTNKAFNMDDLKPYLTRFGSAELVLEPKYDGCAAVLSKTPTGMKLVLEGDGIKGKDITRHLSYLTMNFEPCHTQTCEIIIPLSNWNPDFGANPRNVIAGWLNRIEFYSSNNIAHIVSHNYGPLSIPYAFTGDLEAFESHLLKAYASWSTIYPIDGIMIKPRDEKRRIIAGSNGTTYAWSIAWKPPIQIAETTVTEIEWNVSRQGRIIPTVIYTPIELCKTINSRATANNAKWLVDKNIQVGSILSVGKAGEIIPKILEVKNPPTNQTPADEPPENTEIQTTGVPCPFNAVLDRLHITTPTPAKPSLNRPLNACPICNGPTKWSGVDLICDSPSCIGQLIKQVAYFYSKTGFDLKSIGENMITKLILEPVTFKILVEHPWALLDPESFNILQHLYIIWGAKRTNTYLDELIKIKGRKNKAHFIASMGYPGLAYKTVLKIFYFIQDGIVNSNIPQKAQTNFVQAFVKFQQIESLLSGFEFAPLPESPQIIYCITGSLATPRVELIDYATKFRWEWSNQVSKFVNFLVIGSDPGKTKITKAEQLGTICLTEKQFMEMLK